MKPPFSRWIFAGTRGATPETNVKDDYEVERIENCEVAEMWWLEERKIVETVEVLATVGLPVEEKPSGVNRTSADKGARRRPLWLSGNYQPQRPCFVSVESIRNWRVVGNYLTWRRSFLAFLFRLGAKIRGGSSTARARWPGQIQCGTSLHCELTTRLDVITLCITLYLRLTGTAGSLAI